MASLPSAPNSISLLNIRNAFHNQGSPNPTTYGTSNSNLFSLDYYRGKYYWNGSSYAQFSSGTLTMDDFRGKYSNCSGGSDCVCAGDSGDSGDGV